MENALLSLLKCQFSSFFCGGGGGGDNLLPTALLHNFLAAPRTFATPDKIPQCRLMNGRELLGGPNGSN